MSRPWLAGAASAIAYTVVTAVFARELLSSPAGAIAGDVGDPLFVAAILHWNATVPPFTDGWWQLPIFYPTRDALAFSEHFLGLAPLTTPLQWITGSPVAAYNLATVLTFPLCGLAMFALVYRLTRVAAAAFIAGLAFAFAPYRVSHLPHLQMLAFFWAPIALLGLHAYLESRRRRWLVLYGAGWMLQAASNTYTLVFFSMFVAFWMTWFVIARRNWRALGAIAVATGIAALPLLPIVAQYALVHARHGFTRDLAEMRGYSADLAAVLCAPAQLTFWRWLRIGCRPEGELFPGLTVTLAAAAALAALWRGSDAARRGRGHVARIMTIAGRVLLVAGAVALAAACSVALGGPWAFALGPIRISVSSAAKPVMLAVATMVIGVLLAPGIRRAARESSTLAFYLLGALFAWLLALGPTVTFMGEPRGIDAPFALLLPLPGVSGLRVPARFWIVATMCLAVVAGLVAAWLAGRWRSGLSRAALGTAVALLLVDGWVSRIPAVPVPSAVSDPASLTNRTVLTLPVDSLRDIAAQFRAVVGGWRSLNGYSGYFPSYYYALADGLTQGDAEVLAPFLERTDLHVLVERGAESASTLIERQPGAVLVARGTAGDHFHIPRRSGSGRRGEMIVARATIRSVNASCAASSAGHAADDDERTRWECNPQRPGQTVVVDLGSVMEVTSVAQVLGDHVASYPRHLVIDTSTDRMSWQAGWNGSVRRLLIEQELGMPKPSLRFLVPLQPREARYVRLTQTATWDYAAWTIAELQVYVTGP